MTRLGAGVVPHQVRQRPEKHPDFVVGQRRRVAMPLASRPRPRLACVISYSIAWRRSVSAVLVASTASISTRLRNFSPRAPCSPMVFAANSAAITTSLRTESAARAASLPRNGVPPSRASQNRSQMSLARFAHVHAPLGPLDQRTALVRAFEAAEALLLSDGRARRADSRLERIGDLEICPGPEPG